MGILDAWVTSLAYSDINMFIAMSMLWSMVALLLGLVYTYGIIAEQRQALREQRIIALELDEQIEALKNMLVATKFLTLNPEVFADEHKEAES